VARLALTERIRASPYYPALVHPVFRRILPGAAASALGDGMSAVAIAWLALKLAPAGSSGLWVGAAVAAYTLPGAVGAIALRRWLSGRHGTGLDIVNAVLRAVALGVVGCLALAGLLDPPAYVALLVASSPRRLVAADRVGRGRQVHPDRGPVPGRPASRREHRVQPGRPDEPDDRPASHTPPSGWALIRSAPVLAGLLALSFGFYLLYGPLEVALPVHVAPTCTGRRRCSASTGRCSAWARSSASCPRRTCAAGRSGRS
jgi:DHA3 family macrolide efflux protein-like MFS transporter